MLVYKTNIEVTEEAEGKIKVEASAIKHLIVLDKLKIRRTPVQIFY